MSLAPKHEDLEGLSDEELIARYNSIAVSTVVGTQFYRDEIARRQAAKESARMLSLTETMSRLTWVMLALTVINVVVAAVPIFR